MDITVVEELVQKTSKIMPKGDRVWSVFYTVFSANGWTKEAKEKAQQLTAQSQSKRWQVNGIRLIDLEELDADLIRWSTWSI